MGRGELLTVVVLGEGDGARRELAEQVCDGLMVCAVVGGGGDDGISVHGV